jgi:2-methylcitrate dehydratase PrpD
MQDASALDASIDRFASATDYGILRAGHKLLPVVSNLQSPILLLADIIRTQRVTAEDIERIDVALSGHSIDHGASIDAPQEAIGAQVSLAFSLAIRLLKGSNDLSLYADPSLWRDPDVMRVARKVHAREDPHFAAGKDRGSRVTVTLRDGRVLERQEEYAKGQPENPCTAVELETKFRELSRAVLSATATEESIRTVGHLEEVDDVGTLVALLRHDG